MTEGSGDTQGPRGKFGVFVRALLLSDDVDRVRGSILENAASLEFSINEVLGARLASSIEASNELAVNVLTRLPVRDRIAMLDRHMKATDADELWPLLVPVLRRVYDLRNHYAHGWVTRLSDGGVQIRVWNRGKDSTFDYHPDHLMWLAYEARIASIDLARLWAFWAPSEPAWHGDEAFE